MAGSILVVGQGDLKTHWPLPLCNESLSEVVLSLKEFQIRVATTIVCYLATSSRIFCFRGSKYSSRLELLSTKHTPPYTCNTLYPHLYSRNAHLADILVHDNAHLSVAPCRNVTRYAPLNWLSLFYQANQVLSSCQHIDLCTLHC